MHQKHIFPKLYKASSKGQLLEWEIRVEDNTIITSWGKSGGKAQVTRDVIKAGKNSGRKNATTPAEQAMAEARSAWELKQTKGAYVESSSAALSGSSASTLVTGGVLPMLAHRYDEYADKIVWPAYVQPKLDGHRCIAVIDADNKCTLWSRTRKPIYSVPHIIAALEALGTPGCTYDGELYREDFSDRFEELTSLIRAGKPKPNHAIVQYHIYDVIMAGTFEERNSYLGRVLCLCSDPLVRVETTMVNDANELQTRFKSFLHAGYEGAMVRNAAGIYVHGRSYDLQKVKVMQDAEFTISGVKEGRGKLSGHGIFTCMTDTGDKFDVKMAGATSELIKFLAKPSDYIGRQLVVQFQGYTSSGVPRFPVGLRIREDI